MSGRARKERRKRRARDPEQVAADEAIARLYALDRAERFPTDEERRAAKIRDFGSAYGFKPGMVVSLGGTRFRADDLLLDYAAVSELPHPPADKGTTMKPKTILGARVDLLVVDEVTYKLDGGVLSQELSLRRIKK